jgi:hypothetical protein
VEPLLGWLEGNAVELPSGGVGILLRVSSLPLGQNTGALLVPLVPGSDPAGQALKFASWVDMPGGLTKFTVRRHAPTGLYVTLSNYAPTSAVTEWPGCFAHEIPPPPPPPGPRPCCSLASVEACDHGCVWCQTVSRNNLTLATSPDLVNWTVGPRVMYDESGNVEWMARILTGFQYVDWQFSGEHGESLEMLVRAGYRGAAGAHNANRMFFQPLDWADLMQVEIPGRDAASVA